MTAQPSASGVDRRDCALYRFWVRHPATGRVVLGYVGETVRMPFVRLMEHIYDQPWADTIVRWEVDSTTYSGKAAVLAAEKAAIERERPLYNVEWNMGNPLRVKPWEAVAQRQAREPGWQPPVKKTRVPRQRRTATAASAPTAAAGRVWEWTPERIRVAAWAAGWLLVAVVVGWQAASGPVATAGDGLAYGAGTATAAVGLLLPGKRRRRRRPRR